jgi:hypothetical protein
MVTVSQPSQLNLEFKDTVWHCLLVKCESVHIITVYRRDASFLTLSEEKRAEEIIWENKEEGAEEKCVMRCFMFVLNQVPHHEDVWWDGGVAPCILTSTLHGIEWSASRAGRFNPGTQSTEGRTAPRAGLDAMMKRKERLSCHCRELNYGHLACSLVTTLTELIFALFIKHHTSDQIKLYGMGRT